jgi:hypothetical protein
MASKSKQRYILHKPDDSSGPKVCAFFKTDKGCKSGAACKFSHGDVATLATPKAPPKVVAPPPQIVSPPPTALVPSLPTPAVVTTNTPKTSEKKKRKSTEDPENEQQKKMKSKHVEEQKKVAVPSTPNSQKEKKPVTPKSAFPVTPFHPGYRPSDDDEDESSFLNFAVNSALSQTPEAVQSKPTFPSFAAGVQPSATFANFFLPTVTTTESKSADKTPKEKTPKKSPGKALVVQQQPQVSREAPVVSFVLPQSQSQALVPKQQTNLVPHAVPFHLPTAAPPISFSSSPSQSQVAVPAPTLHVPVDPRVADWSDLVQQCANHSRYAKDYTFASDSEWVQAKPHGEW